MTEIRFQRAERRHIAAEDPEHCIGLRKIIDRGTRAVGIDETDIPRPDTRNLQGPFHRKPRTYALGRAGSLMIGLGSIAPALKTAVSAIRSPCRKDEIPGSLAEIEPGPAFVEWPA